MKIGTNSLNRKPCGPPFAVAPDKAMHALIYKICTAAHWEAAQATGHLAATGIDATDGYMHFSAASQVQETAKRHFCGQPGLVLLTVATQPLGRALTWEPSRGGALFPHLYGPLPVAAVQSAMPLPLDAHGVPRIPALDDGVHR